LSHFKGAREHNLCVTFDLFVAFAEKLICFSGVLGQRQKARSPFDTLSRRRPTTLTSRVLRLTRLRQFMAKIAQPDVDLVNGLKPLDFDQPKNRQATTRAVPWHDH